MIRNKELYNKCIQMINSGYTVKEIASKLILSEGCVRVYARENNLMARLRRNRISLEQYGVRNEREDRN